MITNAVVGSVGVLLITAGFYFTKEYFPWSLSLNITGGFLFGVAAARTYFG